MGVIVGIIAGIFAFLIVGLIVLIGVVAAYQSRVIDDREWRERRDREELDRYGV
jgi:hypothetical protein